MKEAALRYDPHLKKWELWFQGRPVVSSISSSVIRDWAQQKNYKIVGSKEHP